MKFIEFELIINLNIYVIVKLNENDFEIYKR